MGGVRGIFPILSTSPQKTDWHIKRLLDLVTGIDSAASAEDIIEAILQDVAHFVGDAEQYDDMTVVVVRTL